MSQETAIDFFIHDLDTLFGESFCLEEESLRSLILLKSSIFETITQIKEKHKDIKVKRHKNFVLNLIDSSPEENIYISIKEGDTSRKDVFVCNIAVFQNISTSNSLDNEKMISSIKRGHFFQVGNCLHTVEPSYGQCTIKSKGSKATLAICTPVFKRFALLDVWLKYMSLYLIPNLEEKGYNTTLVIAGGEEEFDVVRPYMLFGNIVFLNHENILGDKKNILLDFSKEADFDYLTYIDSDDFFNATTLDMLIDKAKVNSFWSSVQGCCFLDINTMKAGVFTGYGEKKELHGWGLGSGRVFTKKIMLALDKSPFPPLNKSMDFYIRECLQTFNVPKESRLVPYIENEDSKLFIGVKSNENIWGFDQYSLAPISIDNSRVSWLPKPIIQELQTLKN